MKRILFFAVAAAAALHGLAALRTEAVSDPMEEIFAGCPEMAGGIYFAYPVDRDSVAPAPEGFEPVYISHYGRHGSRWPVKEKIYKVCTEFFQQQQLLENVTPEGKGVWKLVNRCYGDAAGHLGELTQKGERQHRAIAERLVASFPTLFADSARAVMRSSVVPRCIMSMAAFSDRLRELNPDLRISRHASPGDMEFMDHKSPELALMTGDDAPWMWDFHTYRDSVSTCRDAALRLFKKVPENDSLPLFMRSLYDIAISVQNIDSLEADIFSVFTPAELAGLWKSNNYIQYVGCGNTPVGEYAGVRCAVPLLDEIVERADEMLASGEVRADLRFGHDTSLLRLVSLTGIGGNGSDTEDPEVAARVWRNFEISPMGANLQLIFYKNKKGEVIVAPRLNEVPVAVSDVPQVAPGFYDWELLKIYFKSLPEQTRQ